LTGYKAPSSQAYKDLVVGLLDGSYAGPTRQALDRALTGIYGIAFAREHETVEDIYLGGSMQIFTDKNVYTFPVNCTPLVSLGEVLQQGQALTSAVRLLKPPLVALPADVTQISLPASMLDPSLAGPLTFTNTLETLTVSTVSGYTKVTWPMPDDSGAVAAFFTLLHARGVAASATLANYLDTRPSGQTTQPTAANLPTQINPALLLLNTVLRNQFWLVLVNEDQVQEQAQSLPTLRRLLPAEQGLLVVTL
jgi:hypothetical protein